jgi:TrmH family RNA methyltransferase
LVKEALHSKANIRAVVYSNERGIPSELLPMSLQQSTEWIAASEECMRKCSDTVHPQGIFAVVEKWHTNIEPLLNNPQVLAVVTDGVQDPGNLGTIIRSADAAGADGVILGKGTVDLYNPKTVRSTMGSLFHLPIIEGDLSSWLPLARVHGIRTVSATLEATRTCFEFDLKEGTWIILGNEANGVSSEVRQLVTDELIIPMKGGSESLNVAMAATILLYEALRQRSFQTNKNTSW